MTTRPFSRCRSARRGMYGSATCAHGDGRLDAGLDARLLAEVLEREAVHDGAEHAHVVGAVARPCRSADSSAPRKKLPPPTTTATWVPALTTCGDLFGDVGARPRGRPRACRRRTPPRTASAGLADKPLGLLVSGWVTSWSCAATPRVAAHVTLLHCAAGCSTWVRRRRRSARSARWTVPPAFERVAHRLLVVADRRPGRAARRP